VARLGILLIMEKPEPQPKYDVGVIGAGQLARMMAQAAIALGLRLRLFAQSATDGAALIWPDVEIGSPDDPDAVAAFASECGIVTFDHELVPQASLDRLTHNSTKMRPGPSTLAYAQDKRWQRERFAQLGFPVPPFRIVKSAQEVAAFAIDWGWPLALKTSYGGYDGRGTWRVENPNDATTLIASLSTNTRDLIVERWIPIEREIAVMVARSPSGQIATYPVVQTLQIDGICREIVAPAALTVAQTNRVIDLTCEIAKAIDLTGMMAVEFFVAGEDILINEIATRPHNSGHYTIEGCTTSQFEQHLRAVMDWPLGATDLRFDSVVTVNILGGSNAEEPRAGLPEALAIEGVHIHLYGKGARPGRKLGHVTAVGTDPNEVRGRAWRAAEKLTGEPAEVAK
jgi:5-(carboxyamino)imidazole ribonucleotide synthase